MGDFLEYQTSLDGVEDRQESLEQAERAGFWRTRDRRKIHVTKMDDDHLRNTLKMLTRKAVDKMVELVDDDEAYLLPWEEFVPTIFWKLRDEFQRRGYEIAWLTFYAKDFWENGK